MHLQGLYRESFLLNAISQTSGSNTRQKQLYVHCQCVPNMQK